MACSCGGTQPPDQYQAAPKDAPVRTFASRDEASMYAARNGGGPVRNLSADTQPPDLSA